MEEKITAQAAAECLARRFGGMTRAKQAIALGLREGVLTAWATLISTLRDSDKITYEENFEEPLRIDTGIWAKSHHPEGDLFDWNWEEGTFIVETGGGDPGDYYQFDEVWFSASEIEAVDPNSLPFRWLLSTPTERTDSRDAAPIAARARRWDWEAAFAALIAVAELDGLTNTFGDIVRLGGQAKLEKWFAEWFRDKSIREGERDEDRLSPSEGECRKRARLVTAAVRSHQTVPDNPKNP